MKHHFLLLLLLSPLLFAEDQGKKVQRLETVIWNPVTHILSWQISEGHIDVHGQYEPERLIESFFLEPQAAMMSFAGERQGFTHQEGDRVHDILDSLSHYLMSSTLWWQEGKDVSLERNSMATGHATTRTPRTPIQMPSSTARAAGKKPN